MRSPFLQKRPADQPHPRARAASLILQGRKSTPQRRLPQQGTHGPAADSWTASWSTAKAHQTSAEARQNQCMDTTAPHVGIVVGQRRRAPARRCDAHGRLHGDTNLRIVEQVRQHLHLQLVPLCPPPFSSDLAQMTQPEKKSKGHNNSGDAQKRQSGTATATTTNNASRVGAFFQRRCFGFLSHCVVQKTRPRKGALFFFIGTLLPVPMAFCSDRQWLAERRHHSDKNRKRQKDRGACGTPWVAATETRTRLCLFFLSFQRPLGRFSFSCSNKSR
ncbi:hypothetical protein psal_cds_393 [Pandoravirus salinus]|uniref:Uncharacterized protein n=1 Tax=Pandoravirus salinus TaxID=1349410 RepID=S4VU88_9VIRU|nr:hypothetical protein psal_cds_393 [Pandoravirus salinus]AGO84084.1 hypothetical protein psal_cds_393 [Pandoravirus salinus]